VLRKCLSEICSSVTKATLSLFSAGERTTASLSPGMQTSAQALSELSVYTSLTISGTKYYCHKLSQTFYAGNILLPSDRKY